MKNIKLKFVVATVSLLLLSNISLAQQMPAEQLGKVSFQTSCDRKVQPAFDRAVAMLHSFWFQQGEKAFREILERDPTCAVATWGIASILIGNTFAGAATAEDARRAREAIQRGRLIGAKTERERGNSCGVRPTHNTHGRRGFRRRRCSKDGWQPAGLDSRRHENVSQTSRCHRGASSNEPEDLGTRT